MKLHNVRLVPLHFPIKLTNKIKIRENKTNEHPSIIVTCADILPLLNSILGFIFSYHPRR